MAEHYAYLIQSFIWIIFCFISLPLVVIQLKNEKHAKQKLKRFGLPHVAHRVIFLIVLLNCVRGIDPFSMFGILSNFTINVISEENSILLMELIILSGYYLLRPFLLDGDITKKKFVKIGFIGISAISFFSLNSFLVISTIADREWTRGIPKCFMGLLAVGMGLLIVICTGLITRRIHEATKYSNHCGSHLSAQARRSRVSKFLRDGCIYGILVLLGGCFAVWRASVYFEMPGDRKLSYLRALDLVSWDLYSDGVLLVQWMGVFFVMYYTWIPYTRKKPTPTVDRKGLGTPLMSDDNSLPPLVQTGSGINAEVCAEMQELSFLSGSIPMFSLAETLSASPLPQFLYLSKSRSTSDAGSLQLEQTDIQQQQELACDECRFERTESESLDISVSGTEPESGETQSLS